MPNMIISLKIIPESSIVEDAMMSGLHPKTKNKKNTYNEAF